VAVPCQPGSVRSGFAVVGAQLHWAAKGRRFRGFRAAAADLRSGGEIPHRSRRVMEPKLKAVIEVMFELLEMSKIEQAKMRDESKRGFCEMPSDTPHDCPNGQTFNGRIKMTATP